MSVYLYADDRTVQTITGLYCATTSSITGREFVDLDVAAGGGRVEKFHDPTASPRQSAARAEERA